MSVSLPGSLSLYLGVYVRGNSNSFSPKSTNKQQVLPSQTANAQQLFPCARIATCSFAYEQQLFPSHKQHTNNKSFPHEQHTQTATLSLAKAAHEQQPDSPRTAHTNSNSFPCTQTATLSLATALMNSITFVYYKHHLLPSPRNIPVCFSPNQQ